MAFPDIPKSDVMVTRRHTCRFGLGQKDRDGSTTISLDAPFFDNSAADCFDGVFARFHMPA